MAKIFLPSIFLFSYTNSQEQLHISKIAKPNLQFRSYEQDFSMLYYKQKTKYSTKF